MVVTDLSATSDTWVWQENARLPSMCTMQAPHRPVPQPNLVPVSFRPSRTTQSSGVSGGASTDTGLPFTVKLVAIASSQRPCEAHPHGAIFRIVDLRAVITAGSRKTPGACRACCVGIAIILHRTRAGVEGHRR